MKHVRTVCLSLAALLPLCGCKSNTSQATPATINTPPVSQPTPAVSDAAKQEDERFKREVEAKRRKSHSADIDKTNAYRNYLP